MASAKGPEMLSGFLQSALHKVQRSSSFLNSKQLSKKERKKEKKRQSKLLKRIGNVKYQLLKNSFTPEPKTVGAKSMNEVEENGLLNGVSERDDLPNLKPVESDASSVSDDELVSGSGQNLLSEQAEAALQFTTDGPQVSAFTLELQNKYQCLNSDVEAEKKVTEMVSREKLDMMQDTAVVTETVKEKVEPKPKKSAYMELLQNRKTENKSEPAKSDKVKSGGETKLGEKVERMLPKSDAVLPSPPQAEKRKEETNLIDFDNLPIVNSPKKKNLSIESPLMKMMIQSPSPAKKDQVKESSSGEKRKLEQSRTPEPKKRDLGSRLPEPRIVLYPKENVKPGWTEKLPSGCGFYNMGNTCYLNSTLQVLLHTPALINWLCDEDFSRHQIKCRKVGNDSCTLCAMRYLAINAYKQQGAMSPTVIYNKIRAIGKTLFRGRQEDAHEFLRLLLESMERCYLIAIGGVKLDSRTKETNPLAQIFGYHLRTEVRCLTCRHVSTTFPPQAELQLDIRQVSNVEEGLQFYFQKEKLHDYKCERCKTVQPSTKQQFVEEAPVALSIQLKRFRPDGSKMKKPIKIESNLNLKRFMYDKTKDVNYRLVGVVNHIGGSPHSGHYTAIARASNGQFYDFDDSCVSMSSYQRIPQSEVYVVMYEIMREDLRNIHGSPAKKVESPNIPSKYSQSSTPENGEQRSKFNSFSIPRKSETNGTFDHHKQNGNNPLQPKKTGSFSGHNSQQNQHSMNRSNSFTHRFLDRDKSGSGFGSKFPKQDSSNNYIRSSHYEKEAAERNGGDSHGKPGPWRFQGNFSTNGRDHSPDRSPLKFDNKKREYSASKSPQKFVDRETKEQANRSERQFSPKKNHSDSRERVEPVSSFSSPSKSSQSNNLLSKSNSQSSSDSASSFVLPRNGDKSFVQTKLPFKPVAQTISSWNKEKQSTLGSLMEYERKRPFMKSREETEDDAIDSGRVKKARKSDYNERPHSSYNRSMFDNASRYHYQSKSRYFS